MTSGAQRTSLLAGLILLLNSLAASAEPAPLVVGLAPNVSARGILAAYQPLREHLQRRLGRPVELYTAPDFAEFYTRANLGEYDLALMPAHLARLAQIETGLRPLAQFSARQRGMVLVQKSSNLRAAGDLKGHVVALADPLALVTARGQEWLRVKGVGRGFQTARNVYLTHHDAAILAVANGEVDAAIVSSIPFYLSRPEARAQVRVLDQTSQFPSNFFVASKALAPAEAERLLHALLAFPASSREARAFFERFRLLGLETISTAQLRALDADARYARATLDARAVKDGRRP